MKEELRTLFVTRLIEAIALIAPGSRFERFGGSFLRHYLGIPLNNRGLNVLGNPVGHTVDTISDLGDIAAEYTIEKGYFDKRMEKAWKDVRHAREAHPNSKHIFLLCTETTPPSRFDRIARAAGRCHRRHGVQVHLYDCRRIAETLVDHLLASDSAIDELGEYIPPLTYIRDEHEASLLCPDPGMDYMTRVDVEKSISDALDARACVIVSGIGGSGKSQTAAAVAKARKEKYDLIIWHDANELVRVEQLHALPIARSGNQRNVGTLLRTLRCLLVLDDLRSDLNEQALAGLCGPNSQVLITRRSGDSGAHQIPPLDRSSTEAMLVRDVKESCPRRVLDRVWSTIGGHPLTLRIMNAAVRDGGASWADIAEDCAAVGELTDDRQERVADRVLKRLIPAVGRELSLFSWAGQPACDRGFARSTLKPVGIRKLNNFCLTSADTGSAIRIHDVVFACLRSEQVLSAERARDFTDALDAYIRSIYDKDLELVSISHGMTKKLEALVRSGERRATFLYSLIKGSDATELDQGLVGNIAEYVHGLTADGNQSEIVVAVALEAIESRYRHEKAASDVATAKAALTTYLPLFDELAKLPDLSARSIAEIEHHRAKALNLTGDRARAIAGFEAVLSGPCPLDATRLQLIRIYGRDGAKSDRAEALASEILEKAARNAADVATSIVLAAIEAVPWTTLRKQRAELSNKYGDLIEERIIAAAAAGSEQPYQTFASIGRYWAWQEQGRFMRVWTALPRRSAEEITRDQDRFAYGDILRQAAQRMNLAAEESAKLREEALVVFSAIQNPTPYQTRTKGQLLVEMNRNCEAESLLLAITDAKQEPWRSYWLSKARIGLGNAKEALADIDNALAQINRESEYWSTFKAQRFETRIALGDPAAAEELREAIVACKDERYKDVLQNRLKDFELKSPS
jgi:hypothetical protein